MSDEELARLVGEIEVSTMALHAMQLRLDREVGELRFELGQRRLRDMAVEVTLGAHSVRHDRIPLEVVS